MKVCHFTSVHSRYDTRIFKKEIPSLLNSGYEVDMIVADGKGNNDHSQIYDVGQPSNKLSRIIFTTKKIRKLAIHIDADIYHFHDPELLPVGSYLKRRGKKVIFDSHEDVPKQILSKPYLNKVILKIISFIYSLYEKIVCKKFDLIITATESIKNKFLKMNENVEVINNYPLISETTKNINLINKEDVVCYVGGISRIRGITEIIKSMKLTQDTKFILAGSYDEESLKDEHMADQSWDKVDYRGYANENQKMDIYRKAKAGLVTFLNYPNHIDAQPNKMFEYMGIGLPVIASDFELWKNIIETNDCGICVNPTDPHEIAQAIKFIVNNPEKAEAMGRNGQIAVQTKYNWEYEKNKLIKLYNGLTQEC